jgi:hypothetical protein
MSSQCANQSLLVIVWRFPSCAPNFADDFSLLLRQGFILHVSACSIETDFRLCPISDVFAAILALSLLEGLSAFVIL